MPRKLVLQVASAPAPERAVSSLRRAESMSWPAWLVDGNPPITTCAFGLATTLAPAAMPSTGLLLQRTGGGGRF